MAHGSVSFILAGDTHTGSNYGLCSPEPEVYGDTKTYYFSKRQEKLYNGFQSMCDEIQNKNNILAFITTGDLVEGPNLHKTGKDVWTTNPLEAIYDISQIFMPLARKARVVRCVRGSGYHVEPGQTQINYDELVANMIGGDLPQSPLASTAQTLQLAIKQGKSKSELIEIAKNGNNGSVVAPDHPIKKKLKNGDNIFKRDLLEGNGNGFHDRSTIKYKATYNGAAIMVKHVGSYSPNPMYRGTGMTRNDVIMTLQADKHFPDGYDSIANFYGHSHYYFVTGNATHYNINVPCWKMNDTFLQEKGVTEPELGIMEFVVEPNGRTLLYPHVVGKKDYPVEPPEVLS